MAELSKSEIDRLGERLRQGSPSEKDLRALDEYRSSFGAALESVLQTIRQHGANPTGRIAKTTHSIVEKLQRESGLRLSRMQDIAGCRVIVPDIKAQDRLVSAIRIDFPDARLIDRRLKPSHGYRAVHLIPKVEGKLVEIQARSSLQHLWAELSEKFSDVIDPTIKYGGGSEPRRAFLTQATELIAAHEALEMAHFEEKASLKEGSAAYNEMKRAYEADERKLVQWKKEIASILRAQILLLEQIRNERS